MTVTTQFSISTSNCKHLTFAGKVKGLYDAQAPACPVCKAVLRPGELQEHMEQELAKLAQLQIRYHAHALRILCFISQQRTFPSYHRLKSLHYLRLSVCHFLAVLFSFEVIIKVDRSLSLDAPPPSVSPGGNCLLLCHLRAVFTSRLIVPYIFHIIASGLKATTHRAGR